MFLLVGFQHREGVLQPMTENIFEIMFKFFGPLSLISIFAVGFYLHRYKLYTVWELRTTLFWPELLIKYRDHTKSTYGHTGIWFYVAIISLVMSIISILALFVVQAFIPLLKKGGVK